VRRKEDPRLLTGRGQFVDDISLPGMLHVAFARSPIARGNVLSINTEAARESPACMPSTRSKTWPASRSTC
jgi:carbon-monoxide dehydrogenase large subunit